MGVRRDIDRKKVGFRSLKDANLEGQVGVNKFKLYQDQVLLYNAIKGWVFLILLLRIIFITIKMFTFLSFWFAIKLTIVFQFHSNKLRIAHNYIQYGGNFITHFYIQIRIEDIEK